MWRRFGVVVAALALLVGFLAAPHTHVHHAAGVGADALHSHGATLVHAHLAPHSRAADPVHPEGTDDPAPQQISSVDAFVFGPGAASYGPVPLLLRAVVTDIADTSVWHRVIVAHPTAHGPPPGLTSDLRAPPALPPSLV